MLPRGSAPLIEMRKSGQVPDGQVWVSYGDFREPDWHRWANTMHSPELIVRPSDPIDRLDLRCVVKLPVTLLASSYDDNAALLFHRLQDYASEIIFLSPDFEDDLGMWWLPQYGVIEYGQRHIVTAYEAAKDCCIFSKSKTQRDIAHAEEMRLLKENPWLRC